MAEIGRSGPTHHRVGDQAELGIDGLSDVTVVGSGGSSSVFRARQEALDRTVAVKVVHSAWSIETRERFEHEREVMGRLSGHTAVVPIFATGITRRGEPYLLMPFYRRGSLFRLMKDRGPMPWREAAFLIEPVAQTLAACHRIGVVHRDVKPGNVLLTDHLDPRLTDFGITLPTGTATTGSAVAYTPSYSPPEAFEAGTAKPTTDVYGLAATLWALLAGRAPFTETGGPVDASAVMERSLLGGLEAPTVDTPAPMLDLLARAMAVAPDQRPADAELFLAELRRAVRLSESDRASEANRAASPSATPFIGSGAKAAPAEHRGPGSKSTVPLTALLSSMVVAGVLIAVVGLLQLLG